MLKIKEERRTNKIKLNQEDKPWCSTWTDSSDQHMSGHWGFCAPVEQVGASLTPIVRAFTMNITFPWTQFSGVSTEHIFQHNS